ncbi:EAL domain-containing protein [Acidithiobacillus caldus]|nr:EAL domain-containing protein [Acidithiobacillus caldus]MBU2783284.1 EAL domain-containing protein [Acidithiobacillus caldus]
MVYLSLDMRSDSDEDSSEATEVQLAQLCAVGLALIRYPEVVIETANPIFLSLLGERNLEAVRGQSLRRWFPEIPRSALLQTETSERPGTRRSFCLRRLRSDGSWQIVDVAVCPVHESPSVPKAVWTMAERISDPAGGQPWCPQEHRDPLTGLYNRRALDARLDADVAEDRDVLLCILDLDDFAAVNQRYGHETADAMLREVAHRLETVVPSHALLARLGGDEFAVLLDRDMESQAVEALLWNIESAVGEAIVLEGAAWSFSISAGVCHHRSGSGRGAESIVRRTDQALYLSKAHKQDRSRFWTVFGDGTPVRPNLCQILLGQGAVEVHYQPILDTFSGRIVAIEALARMREASGTIYLPAQFLPQMSVENGAELSRVVLTRALSDLARLDQGGYRLGISFNLSPLSLDRECVSCLRKVVQESGIEAHRITVEILESSDFSDIDRAIETLREIRELGLELALDDMGSAYASLLRLKNLPVGKIKLDQSFVSSLERTPEDLHIVRAIQDLAADLRLDLVAEGVETEAVLDTLVTMGIPAVQGFAVSHPLTLERLQAFLQEFHFSREPLPRTLFGFYAGTMASHATICRMLTINPTELNLEHLPLASHCRGHAVLERLGHPHDSPLGVMHQRYHEALGKTSELGLGACHSRQWEQMQEIFDTFMAMVLSAWRREQRGSKG